MARYIVNPGNAVHSVEESEFQRLTLLPGYREATSAEVADWYQKQRLPVPDEFTSSPANKLNLSEVATEPPTDAPKDDNRTQLSDPASGSPARNARTKRR